MALPWPYSYERNQDRFRTNRSTACQILTLRYVIEVAKTKNLSAMLLSIDFSKTFDFIHLEKIKEVLLAWGIPSETVNVIMILHSNSEPTVCLQDGNRDLFDIITNISQADTQGVYVVDEISLYINAKKH